MARVYFYPHRSFRDRHLDTIRAWPREQVVNPEIVDGVRGAQVSREQALSSRVADSWLLRVPLLNLKRRPADVPADATVYVWGALVATGPFIVDLDNPYAFTGYNLRALRLYRAVIRRMLLGRRCLEIRCISDACRRTLGRVLGADVARKAVVVYPRMQPPAPTFTRDAGTPPRLLFVGTQFDIKGGPQLLRAFRRVQAQVPSARLDMVTHLPDEHRALAESTPGLRVHEARFRREEIWERFMRDADVLVLPSFVESFGMVVLEGMAHGLAIVASDLYAMREMVTDGRNGTLIHPPFTVWENDLPTVLYEDLPNIKRHIAAADTRAFEDELYDALLRLCSDEALLLRARRESLRWFPAHAPDAAVA